MKYRAGRYAALAAVFAVALVNAGCLVKETTATLCLEPDGSVHWSVLQYNIHATGDTPAARQREERDFMAQAETNSDPVAESFRALGGGDVKTRVVAAAWPFAVLNEADFPDIARLVQECAKQLGVGLQSALARRGERVTWTIDVDASDQADTDVSSHSSPVVDLLPDDRTALFLRHGAFVEAIGFDISDDGRVAKLQDLSNRDWDKEPRLRLSLTWTAVESTTGK